MTGSERSKGPAAAHQGRPDIPTHFRRTARTAGHDRRGTVRQLLNARLRHTIVPSGGDFRRLTFISSRPRESSCATSFFAICLALVLFPSIDMY